MIYPNLRAEFARKGLTISQGREELMKRGIRMTLSTLSPKLNGKYQLSLNEAKAIKDIIGVDIPLEVLFEEAGA